MFKDKSPQIQEVIDNLSLNSFGRKTSTALAQNICVDCGEETKEFKDELSKKEYLITGLCQKCQDYVFDYLKENENVCD